MYDQSLFQYPHLLQPKIELALSKCAHMFTIVHVYRVSLLIYHTVEISDYNLGMYVFRRASGKCIFNMIFVLSIYYYYYYYYYYYLLFV